MKIQKIIITVFAITSLAHAGPSSFTLTDGSVIKGDVVSGASQTATEVVVKTEFGVIRVPMEKITPESRKAAGIGQSVTGADTENRITQLEARIRELETENAKLRKMNVASGNSSAPSDGSKVVPQAPSSSKTEQSDTGLKYSMSSSGKRHNSRCRFYASDKPCSSSDGVACKICGG